MHTYICRGKDCRRAKGFAELEASLPGAQPVPCQKICKGPVAGVDIDGRPHWFAKLRKAKLRAAIVHLAATGEIVGRLAKRLVAKRTGQLRFGKLGKKKKRRSA